jgi:hypothetical protein
VGPLRSQARSDTYSGRAARRVLSSLFVQASFYLWRNQLESGQVGRAVFLQQVALQIEDSPMAWFRLGLTYAAAGDRRRALAALETAVDKGFAATAAFDDPRLSAVRGDAAFESLRARVAAKAR